MEKALEVFATCPPDVFHTLTYISKLTVRADKNKNLRQKRFFIHLGFEPEKMHHWEHDNPGCLLKTILAGLHEWKKEPPIKIPNRNMFSFHLQLISDILTFTFSQCRYNPIQ
jgi:hypothetical protein